MNLLPNQLHGNRTLLSTILLLALLCCSACQGPLIHVKQPLVDEGELFVYMQPFPQDAGNLSFSLENVSAVRDDGVSFPLHLRLADLSPSVVNRQRFIASGPLPQGSYRGISFKAKRADLKTEDGSAALLLPENATLVNFPFAIKDKNALVVALNLKFKDVFQDGFRFTPTFSPFIPTRPLPGLTGYVSNTDSNSVSVFDKKTAEVLRVIETGRNPSGMALDQKMMRLYIALPGDDAVDVVDTGTDNVIARIRLNFGDTPREIFLTPDGGTLLTVNSGSNTISLVDTLSLHEATRITVGNEPVSAIIDKTGRRAYVFNYLSSSISIIDIAAKTVASTISTDGSPLRGIFNLKGDQLRIIYSTSPNLLTLDTASLRTLGRLYVGIGANTLKGDSTTDFFYVGSKFDQSIQVFTPLALMPFDTVRAAAPPAYMTIDSEYNNLLLVLPHRQSLQFINLVSRQPVAEADVGESPYWVVVNGER